MGLTKCCCCVDLLKGVKILGIVLTIVACIGIIATIVSSSKEGPNSLYELIALIPGFNFLKLQGSILTTFYMSLFCTKAIPAAFSSYFSAL